MKGRPRWSLAEVRKLAAEDRLVLTHAACEHFSTRSEAFDWILGVIGELGPADFAHSIRLEVHTADVYGVVVDGLGWYLKLTPLERPLETRRGTIEP